MDPTPYKPSKAAVLEYMTAHPALDWFTAEEHLIQKHADGLLRQRKLPPAENETLPPWRTEPRPEEIRYEMHVHGCSFAAAQAKLRREMAAEARQLAEFAAADVTSEISELLDAADKSREAAESLIQENQVLVD